MNIENIRWYLLVAGVAVLFVMAACGTPESHEPQRLACLDKTSTRITYESPTRAAVFWKEGAWQLCGDGLTGRCETYTPDGGERCWPEVAP